MVYLCQRPSELQRTHRDANNAQVELDASQGDFLENVMPGNRQYMDELVEQWTSVGGQIPQPDTDQL
ncbi:MAG: hypothetical protein QOE71_2752 [Pseudonocardiales bacterium]|nr:hypothetical protein [Pseudonocardiales bacterium]